MNSSIILFLATALLIIASGFTWVMLRRYSQRLLRIDEELRAIIVMLSEMPKETGLKEYMFAQDQRLRHIGEKLDAHANSDVLQQYIQDQANQIIAIISTHDEARKLGVSKADLEISLQVTNELLERVLWSLRFDEDKYVENSDTNRDRSADQGKKNINIDTKSAKVIKDNDDVSMTSILDGSDDSYSAMLKYMQQSGKSGTEALHALEEAAKFMSNR